MSQSVRSLMTRNPVCLPADAPLAAAAQAMRDNNIGDVLVVDGNRLRGIVTDRDIVIRGVAEDLDLATLTVGQLATEQPTVLGPEDPVDHAVRLMRQHSVRRLPVCEEGGRPVGIISLGDVAMSKQPDSPLADISAAAPTD